MQQAKACALPRTKSIPEASNLILIEDAQVKPRVRDEMI
jgi:hypothetical protein